MARNFSAVPHIDSKLSEIRKPIGRYSVEGVGIVNRIHHTDDMRLANFAFKVLSVVGSACKSVA